MSKNDPHVYVEKEPRQGDSEKEEKKVYKPRLASC